jgi:hypothetical protein
MTNAPSSRPWRFTPLRRTDPKGRNPIFGNFKNEGYTDCQSFVREFLQNTLDNRRKLKGGGFAKARVVFRLLTPTDGLDTAFLKSTLQSLEPHLASAGLPASLRDYSDARVLVVEEFETTGFGGAYDDSRAVGDFAGFFHGEADDTKTGGKNGRAGQGKATYNMISNAGSFLALTVREEDDRRLLMGKASVPKTHAVENRNYLFRGFWSDWVIEDEDDQPVPFEDNELQEQVIAAFKLQRGIADYGSSFVIPFPKPEVTADLIVQVVLEEYFYSIIKGRLEVEVGGIEITSDTVFDLVGQYEATGTSGHHAPSAAFLNFIKSATDLPVSSMKTCNQVWDGAPAMPSELFDTGDLAEVSTALANGSTIWVRLPVQVSPKGSAKQMSYVDVYVCQNDEINRTEEAFIRRDLYIAKEKRLKGIFGQVYALVIAEDEVISDYLAYAEVASHLYWNGKEEKLVERYNSSTTLRAVRDSARRLLELLQGGEEEVSTDLLIDILSIPLGNGDKKARQPGGKGKEKVRPPNPDPPPPLPKYHRITDGAGVRVEAGEKAISTEFFPVTGLLEVAYENVALGGNAFRNYHPFDFDLYDPLTHKISSNGVTLKSRGENKIQFVIESADWFLEVQGFDPNKPIRARAVLDI